MMATDHIRIFTDHSWEWSFWIDAYSEVLPEQREEISTLCSTLFETFGEFVVPQEVEIAKGYYTSDTTVQSIWDETQDRLDFSEETLTESDGVDITDVLSSCTEVSSSYGVHIPRIAVSKAAVQIELPVGKVYANTDAYTVAYQHGTECERNPDYGPLRLRLMQGVTTSDDQIESRIVYYLTVESKTDIWFEDSECGETNAAALGNFLRRIHDALPVKNITRHTSQASQNQMEEIY